MRLSLPQWQRNAGIGAVVERVRRGNAVQKVCRKGASENDVPQRQRIAGNAAVVEGGRKGNAVQKVCRKGAAENDVPQRQRIAENAAVVERAGEAILSRESVAMV